MYLMYFYDCSHGKIPGGLLSDKDLILFYSSQSY